MARFKTIEDAAHDWVREFSAFPTGMIEKLFYECDPDDFYEITVPSYGDRVNLCEPPEPSSSYSGEVFDYDEETDTYEVKMDDLGDTVTVSADDIEGIDKLEALPMWGVMWQFKDALDDEWIENGGLRCLCDCGFRVYRHEEYGYFFGIDGAGYDFYEAHWIPLYKKRGLKWHESGGCDK